MFAVETSEMLVPEDGRRSPFGLVKALNVKCQYDLYLSGSKAASALTVCTQLFKALFMKFQNNCTLMHCTHPCL